MKGDSTIRQIDRRGDDKPAIGGIVANRTAAVRQPKHHATKMFVVPPSGGGARWSADAAAGRLKAVLQTGGTTNRRYYEQAVQPEHLADSCLAQEYSAQPHRALPPAVVRNEIRDIYLH